MEPVSNQTPQSLGTPQGAPQAVSPTGTGQPQVPPEMGIGAFNGIGVNPQKQIQMQRSELAMQGQNNQNAQQQTPALQQNGNEENSNLRQPTEKDARHFAKFVTDAAQEKFDIARLAVETDQNAIYKIAEKDPELAQRLLKEYDFGTDSVEDLLDKKNVDASKNPQEAKKEIEDSKWKTKMENELLEEKVQRLKLENPDLEGPMEEKFRELYKDPTMSKYDIVQKLNMARVLTGTPQTETNADNVALAMLKQQEGSMTSLKVSGKQEMQKSFSPEFKKMQRSMGVQDKDLGILPDNIDEILSQQFGSMIPKA
jgi:hypothetical protein